MNQLNERGKAILDARWLLETLYTAEEPVMWDLVRTVAANVLRHYPDAEDMRATAQALPSVWSTSLFDENSDERKPPLSAGNKKVAPSNDARVLGFGQAAVRLAGGETRKERAHD